GFRTWYSYGCCDDHLRPHYWATDGGREDRIDVEQWSAAHETDRAIDFLDRHGEDPFALVVSWNPPHPPFEQLPHGVHEELAGRGGELLVRPNVTDEIRAEAERLAPLYFTAVHEIDRQVGRILEALAERDLTEDTLVVFTSGHGTQLGSQGRIDKNVPFEESMRIPLIVSGPTRLPSGVCSTLIGSLDLAPTLLGLVGLGDAVPERMVGSDLSEQILSLAAAEADAAVPFFHDEADPAWLQPGGIRTAPHLWVLSSRAGEVRSTGRALAADPPQPHPLEAPVRAAERAARARRVLAELAMPWQPLESWLARAGAA